MIARYSAAILTTLAFGGWFAPARADNRVTVITTPPAVTAQPYTLAAGEQSITGKIDHIDKKKDAAGIKHEIARVKTDHNDKVLVDLGPKDGLRGMDIDKGDRVTIVAVPSYFNGQPVFLAQRIEDEHGRVVQLAVAPPPQPVVREYGDTIRIEHVRPTSPEPEAIVPAVPAPAIPPPTSAAPATPPVSVRTIEGQVMDTWTTNVPNYGELQLARLQARDGTYTVDLGLRSRLPAGFSLAPGSWVQVTGQFTQSGDQQVLLADTLTRSLRIPR